MPIPSEITALIQRLNQELNQIEQEATTGLNIIREVKMSEFNPKELDEKELLELLDLAKEAANSARELCYMAAKHNQKLRKKLEAESLKKSDTIKVN